MDSPEEFEGFLRTMLGFITEEYTAFLDKVGQYYETAQDSIPMIVEDDEEEEFGGYV